ncbi:MAG: hypothetical protein AAF226_12735 [Verrucomicrobiota bacterium]
MLLVEALIKFFVKAILLIVGWPVGILTLKVVSLGNARRISAESDEGYSTAYLIYLSGEDGRLRIGDMTAAWIGAGIVILVIWGIRGFPLPQFF